MATSVDLRETSLKFFPTVPNYEAAVKAGNHLAQLVEQDSEQVFIRPVEELRDYFGKFYAWLWAWSPRHDIRAIVELNDDTREARLIAVLPKGSRDGDYSMRELEALWKAHRTRRRNR